MHFIWNKPRHYRISYPENKFFFSTRLENSIVKKPIHFFIMSASLVLIHLSSFIHLRKAFILFHRWPTALPPTQDYVRSSFSKSS
jgi:hypothetical protein